MELINEHITGTFLPCTVVYDDGTKRQGRFHNSEKYKGLCIRRRRKRYYPMHTISHRITQIILKEKSKEKTPVERIKFNCNKFLKLVDKRLWIELQEKVKKILAEVDETYTEWEKSDKKDDFNWFFYLKYHEGWLDYKNLVMTINTAFGSWYGKKVSASIKHYLDGNDDGFEAGYLRDSIDKTFKYYYAENRYGYDNHIEVRRDRAWLSREYKDCGNGHYYLLISPTHAIFCEDD